MCVRFPTGVNSPCQCSLSADSLARALILVCSLRENSLKEEGAKHVADALAINQTLTSVAYATLRSPNTLALHKRQQPLSVLALC